MGQLFTSQNDALYIGREPAFGVSAAPVEQLKSVDISSSEEVSFVDSASKMGSRALLSPIKTGVIAMVQVKFEGDSRNLGWFLKAIFGSEVVNSLGGGAFAHTFSLLNNSQLPSYSLTVLKGGYKSLIYKGSTANTLSLDLAVDAILSGSIDYQGLDEADNAKPLTAANIDQAADTVMIAGNAFASGDRVRFFRSDPAAVLPSPLVEGQDYFVISTGDAFQVSAAIGGSVLNFSSGGSGAFELMHVPALSPTVNRPFVFADGQIKINDALVGEVNAFSINMNDNLFKQDKRLNYGGAISSLPAGKFEVGGKVEFRVNPDSYFLRADYLSGIPVKLEVILTSNIALGGTFHKLDILINTAALTKGDISGDFLTISADFKAFVTSPGASPVQITLTNDIGTAY